MREIPEIFKKPEYKFVKVASGSKKAVESWKNGDKIYAFNDPEITEWVKKGGNVGIVNRFGDLNVLDSDNSKFTKFINDNYPKTLTIQSSKTEFDDNRHFIFINKTKKIGKWEFKDGFGDLRGTEKNYYTLIPPSIHPDTKESYKILENIEPAEITDEQIETLQQFRKKKSFKKQTTDPLSGVNDGSRNNELFKFACKLRRDEYSYEDALILVTEKNKNCNPPLPEHEVETLMNSAFSYGNETELDESKIPKDLSQVHAMVRKWLFVPDTDYIDVILATTLSNTYDGTPLWVFIMGNSSCGKSAIIKALKNVSYVKELNELTPKSFASGMVQKGKEVKDLGSELQNTSTVLSFADLASLKGLNKDSKLEIFSKLRTLYDGYIIRNTGSGVQKTYDNCHVTLIAGTTHDLKKEFSVIDQMGTREITYEITWEMSYNDKVMEMADKHIGHEKEMKQDITTAIEGFLRGKEFQDIELSENLVKFIKETAKSIVILRAQPNFERGTGFLSCNVDTEAVGRVYKQFLVLGKSLKSLDVNYPDEAVKRILTNVMINSGSLLRGELLDFFRNKKNLDLTIEKKHYVLLDDIVTHFNLGKKTITRECEVLTNMGIIEKIAEWRVRNIGCTNKQYEEIYYGGKVK